MTVKFDSSRRYRGTCASKISWS